MRKLWMRAAAFALLLVLVCCPALAQKITVYAAEYPVEAGGQYNSLEEVAVYLSLYGELPENFLTKKEAQALGWVSSKGNLWRVAPGCAIGGDRFGNYEELVPKKKGRTWTECDIDFDGRYRGPKRIVFSSDGLIYYTADHYQSFDEIEVVMTETENKEIDWSAGFWSF